MKTRAEHMSWCKGRALELVDAGDIVGAFASLRSDFNKHPETDEPTMHMLATVGLLHHSRTAADARKFIKDFA